MMAPQPKEVSELLAQWGNGSQSARDELIPLVYNQLRKLAAYHMARERREHSLQATALVNEAYLRLVDQTQVQFPHRAHFFALASQLMRHILVDSARKRCSAKRGAGACVISLDEAMVMGAERDAEVIALDDALNRLAAMAPRKSQVVELRYFGGLTVEEIAEVVKVSVNTVRRDWTTAKAWLYRAVRGENAALSNSQ
jgi:RNA polymerase sigma-70 factor, ECF subfamily